MPKSISDSKRPKIKGRGKGPSFLMLPHFLIQSNEWRALSGSAIKFLIELASAYDGKNNGDLSFSRKEVKARGWKSNGTLGRAIEEAIEAGFCVVTRHGSRNVCSLYAITWQPIDNIRDKGLIFPAESTASHRWRNRWPQNGASVASKQGQPK